METRAWTPLRQRFPNAVQLRSRVYKVATYQYVLARQQNREGVRGLSDAPFAAAGYWAVCDDAVIRDDEGDVSLTPKPGIRPPDELLLGTDGCYRSLVSCPEVRALGPIGESASYNQEGHMLHINLRTKTFRYCFLEYPSPPDQWPYAIAIRFY